MNGYFILSATDAVLVSLTGSRQGGTFVYVLEFHGLLEIAALEEAWAQTVRRHPILGCSRPRIGGVLWERASPGEPCVGAVEVSQQDGRSTLRLEIDHAAMDGRAAFHVLETLRDRYRFRSSTRTADAGPRNFRQAADRLSPVLARHAFESGRARWASMPRSNHERPAIAGRLEGPEFVRVRLDRPSSQRIVEKAREFRLAMTAVLVAAASVAWDRAASTVQEVRMNGWLVSNDLRSTIAYAGGVGNLSGVEAIWFRSDSSNVRAALHGAARSYRELQAPGAFLASQLAAERWAGQATTRLPRPAIDLGIGLFQGALRYTRIIGNLGAISDELCDWGDTTLVDFFAIPAFKGTAFDVLSASSFHGEISLVARVEGSSLPSSFVSAFESSLDETLRQTADIEFNSSDHT